MTDQCWVALLRGVNVGGGNKVPMAELRRLAEGIGFRDVRSYIASGNLVFRSEGAGPALAARLRQAMVAEMGVDVPILVLSAAAIRDALAACPFRPEQGAHVHVVFLWSPPVVDFALRDALIAPGESLVVEDGRAWLHAPGGIGRSKLAERLHRVLTGTQMTARNLTTLTTLARMLDQG